LLVARIAIQHLGIYGRQLGGDGLFCAAQDEWPENRESGIGIAGRRRAWGSYGFVTLSRRSHGTDYCQMLIYCTKYTIRCIKARAKLLSNWTFCVILKSITNNQSLPFVKKNRAEPDL
jgi:hypothetical protein